MHANQSLVGVAETMLRVEPVTIKWGVIGEVVTIIQISRVVVVSIVVLAIV